jgi:hypothetical protein
MKTNQTSKRMASALIMTAFLAALFLLIAAYGPGSGVQTVSAHKIARMAPAHDGTETREPTETHHPEQTETEHPENTQTAEPTRTHEVEPTETEHPEATETAHPEGTHTPEATETEHPEATETEHPEETRTPEATRTHEVEPTETEHPERTRTPEATETEHPEATETEHPEATETEHPEETRTPHATRTEVPSPEPTGVAPVVKGQPGGIASIPGTGSRTFAATGKTVQGIFLQYWDNNGGLMQQGYPISGLMQERSPLDGKVYSVQYFERAVFEYHSELVVKNNILLSQLGRFRYNAKYPNGAQGQVADKTNATFFPQTGHYVGGVFLKYWQEHGGLAQQGYPLSDEFTEVSPLDGKSYTVQYFERAVFELHPENKAPFNVLLSQLGTFQYKTLYNGK